jgi:hypothetical protein
MTLEQKNRQFFFSSRFINDTEENIQATEELIKKHNIGGLTFFHSRASAATNYETKKNRIQRRQLSATERFNCTISKCATTIVDEHRCRMGLWDAGRKHHSILMLSRALCL